MSSELRPGGIMLARLKFVALIAIAASSAAAQTKSAEKTAKPEAKTAKTATYKRDIPDSLGKHAKISEVDAAKTALAKVPNGKISSMELERENGKLIYSYDIKVPGKSGI